MTITVGTLVVGGLDPVTAKRVCDDLLLACAKFKISTPAQQGAFVAQCYVESMGFTRLEENLNYTTPERVLQVFPVTVTTLDQARRLCRNPIGLANLVYAGKLGEPRPWRVDVCRRVLGSQRLRPVCRRPRLGHGDPEGQRPRDAGSARARPPFDRIHERLHLVGVAHAARQKGRASRAV
jgi:hypothetical protein